MPRSRPGRTAKVRPRRTQGNPGLSTKAPRYRAVGRVARQAGRRWGHPIIKRPPRPRIRQGVGAPSVSPPATARRSLRVGPVRRRQPACRVWDAGNLGESCHASPRASSGSETKMPASLIEDIRRHRQRAGLRGLAYLVRGHAARRFATESRDPVRGTSSKSCRRRSRFDWRTLTGSPDPGARRGRIRRRLVSDDNARRATVPLNAPNASVHRRHSTLRFDG